MKIILNPQVKWDPDVIILPKQGTTVRVPQILRPSIHTPMLSMMRGIAGYQAWTPRDTLPSRWQWHYAIEYRSLAQYAKEIQNIIQRFSSSLTYSPEDVSELMQRVQVEDGLHAFSLT